MGSNVVPCKLSLFLYQNRKLNLNKAKIFPMSPLLKKKMTLDTHYTKKSLENLAKMDNP